MNTDLPPSALHPAFVYRGNPEEIEPTEQEVHEYAEWLGIDLVKEAHLLYIARKGIVAPLPEGWQVRIAVPGQAFVSGLALAIPCTSNDAVMSADSLSAQKLIALTYVQACRSSAGEMYYFNLVTAESLREHPLDVHYKNMVALKRRNLEHSSAAHEPSSENLQDVSPKFSSAAQWHPVHQGCSPDSFSGSQSSPQSASTGVTEPRRTQKDALLEKMPAESNAKHAEQVELLWHSVQRLEGLLAKEESMRQVCG